MSSKKQGKELYRIVSAANVSAHRTHMRIRTMVTGAHANMIGHGLALNVCRIKWRSQFNPVFNIQTQYRHYILVLSKKLLHHVVWITWSFCLSIPFQPTNQATNQSSNMDIVSSAGGCPYTYTVGIKISCSYWYVSAALTWHVIA